MSAPEAFQIWFIVASAIAFSLRAFGELRFSDLLSTFRRSYVMWFENLFGLGRKPHAYRPRLFRVWLVSVGVVLGTVAIMEISNTGRVSEQWSDAIQSIQTNSDEYYDSWLKKLEGVEVFTSGEGVEIPKEKLIPSDREYVNIQYEISQFRTFTKIFATVLILLLGNVLIDRVSIIQSYWFGTISYRSGVFGVFALMIGDAIASFSLAILGLIISVLIYDLASTIGYVWKFLDTVADLKIFWDLFVSTSALVKIFNSLGLTDLAGPIVNTIPQGTGDNITSAISLYPLIIPVFISTMITTIWFQIYAFFCLIVECCHFIGLVSSYLDRVSSRGQSGLAFTVLAIGVFSVVFWVIYVSFRIF